MWPADDSTDPAAVQTLSHLSASIVLSRKRASEGLYPAIDPLLSNSKMATPGVIGERHYALAERDLLHTGAIRRPAATSSPCSVWNSCRPRIARWLPVPGG
ncbi:hypothetical protein ACVBEG_27595 [Pseudomonas sp. GG8]